MPSQLFVNLPVKDLPRSVAFFTALGFHFDPRYTNDSATCMILGEGQFAMLLVEPFFQSFTDKPVADATKVTEVLVALSVASRAEVERICEAAFAAGGRRYRDVQDHDFMFGWGFEDLDGHVWELFWMNPEATGG
jgi:predicted lactoylglutathione lyase